MWFYKLLLLLALIASWLPVESKSEVQFLADQTAENSQEGAEEQEENEEMAA